LSYRNKTYVAFASEDIHYYRLMTAWRASEHIDFDFVNAHDVYQARDSSLPATIKRRLRERLNDTKQVVLLGSPVAKKKAGDGSSFLAYEVEAIMDLKLPVVVANLDKNRGAVHANYPRPFTEADYYTMSVSYGPTIIKYALDNYAQSFRNGSTNTGWYQYNDSVYKSLGLG